ncbi:MAG: efflux RND transporter periplasmic adaptor subunit [Clostridia bacterium]
MKKYIAVFLCSAVLIAGIFYLQNIFNKKEAVSVLNPIRTTIEDFVESSGKISAKNQTKVFSKDGVISKLYFKVGDKVSKGDKIAEVIYADNSEEILANYGKFDMYTIDVEKIKSIPGAKTETIKATKSGYIIEQKQAEGKVIYSSTPIAIISDFKELEITTSVSENKVDRLKTGQKAIVTGEGFKDRIYSATITKIAPIAKQTAMSGYNDITVEVTLDIINPDEKLRPGNSVNVKTLIKTTENSMVIPYEAVRLDEQNNSFVYVVKGDTVEKRIITTSNETSVGVSVVDGLLDTDIIVNNAPDGLDSKRIKPKDTVVEK